MEQNIPPEAYAILGSFMAMLAGVGTYLIRKVEGPDPKDRGFSIFFDLIFLFSAIMAINGFVHWYRGS